MFKFVNWKYVAELQAFGHHRPPRNHSKRQVQILAENHTRHFTCFHPSRCPFQTYASRLCWIQCTRKCNHHHQGSHKRERRRDLTSTIWGFTFCIQLVWWEFHWDELFSRKEWTRQIQPGWRHTYTYTSAGNTWPSLPYQIQEFNFFCNPPLQDWNVISNAQSTSEEVTHPIGRRPVHGISCDEWFTKDLVRNKTRWSVNMWTVAVGRE